MSELRSKWMTAEEALHPLKSGVRVFIGSGCAAPQALVEALAAKGPNVYDVEIIHLLTWSEAPYATREVLGRFRHNVKTEGNVCHVRFDLPNPGPLNKEDTLNGGK